MNMKLVYFIDKLFPIRVFKVMQIGWVDREVEGRVCYDDVSHRVVTRYVYETRTLNDVGEALINTVSIEKYNKFQGIDWIITFLCGEHLYGHYTDAQSAEV